MPVIQRKGAQSSQGFGEFAQSASTAANYIEDYFSTYLYTGTGAVQTINNGIALADTAAWSSYKLKQNNSIGFGVTADSSGNFYVTGYANNGTNNYVLIAKYDSSGTIQWQRKLLENNSYGYGVTTDTSGNVYVTGVARDGSGYDYIIVAKYNSSGTIQWQRKLLQNNSYGYGITIDTSSNVYIIGTANQDGANDYIIIAKYNSSGTIQWQKKLKQGVSIGKGITTDSSGNVYVTGVANDGTNYIIVAKYNSSGTIQWQRNLKQGASYGSGITIDTSSNVYVTGYASDGSGTYIIIAKYDSSGTIQWQRKLRQNASVGQGIAADSSGNVYVTGYANDGANDYIVTSKLKQDGTTTSGTAIVTLSTNAATDSAGTATDSAGTATDSAAGATDSAAGATDSAGTATATSASVAAVTGGGGLVWIKSRSGAYNHNLFDTANGATKLLHSNTTAALTTDTASLTSFTASGFNLGTGNTVGNEVNTSAATFASWTFRKQAKFFDIVTYTGNGLSTQTISHNLGSVPGAIIIKRTDSTSNWFGYFRYDATYGYQALSLNSNLVNATGQVLTTDACTSTTFKPLQVQDYLGNPANINGATYVAYLFAHNAGGFGATGTDNVISCSSFTTDGSGAATVSLGYEPQYLMWKSSSAAGNWAVFDVMRGWNQTASDAFLAPNLTSAESTAQYGTPTATGFVAQAAASTTYIYIAIRRGPMKTPTSGTSVFTPITKTGDAPTASLSEIGFQFDALFNSATGGTYGGSASYSNFLSSRLTGLGSTSSPAIQTSATSVEANYVYTCWSGTSFNVTSGWTATKFIWYFLQRAPGFMDVVCYTGTGANQNITHNLGVVPQLIIVKKRNGTARRWVVQPLSQGNQLLVLNATDQQQTDAGPWNNTAPTSSVFTVGADADTNPSGNTLVAYLFATVAGVSKVGSYTGTGALQTVNCGFTSGARFVLIKRTDSTGDWYVWDSARGISSGNDPYLLLNSNAAEVTTTNYVDTDTTGFKVTAAAPADINTNGGSYIFLAIS